MYNNLSIKTFKKNMPATLGKYQILRTLGSGASCKVKLGLDTESGRKVAIKIIKDCADSTLMDLVRVEVEAMQTIGYHKNVIEQIEVNQGEYVKDAKNGQPPKKKNVTYIVLELATGGEIFDFVAVSGAFSEDQARYFFTQFMQGLLHCHN